MLIFYYAVLSEVSPPTALSCVAVSAITGGNAYKTMWLAWRYTLPAFLVPLLFAAPGGTALLLVGPWPSVALAVATALGGVVALAAGVAGGLRADWPGWLRVVAGLAGLLLLYPDRRADLAGLCALGCAAGGWMAARPAAKRS
jgi:TRAP-type uncharacterized transport system fused permease subunit